MFNHANWHVLSQFAPGEVAGYPYVVFDQLGKFAIPAFMFIAGYFIAYAASGGKRDLPWQVVRARLENLVWPWVIWSVILMVGQNFQGQPLSPGAFLRTLFIQYYFIPLLIFYYLFAPFVVRWARSNARALLVGTAAIQLAAVALFYVRVYDPHFPGWFKPWIDLGPLQYLRFAFCFPFGVVCGIFPGKLKDALARKSILPWLALLAFALCVLEAAVPYNRGGSVWPIGGDQTKLSSALFSIALILCFAAFDKIRLPFDRLVNRLGVHSYGLYLCHYPVLGITAKIIERFAPWVARQGWLLLPLLFGLTVALSMLLMEGAARLPTKRFYHYVFG